MGHPLSGKCVVAGIGATKFGGLPGRSTISLNIEAIRKALADAGIEKDQVDALWVKCPTSKFEFMFGQKVAEAAGIQPKIDLRPAMLALLSVAAVRQTVHSDGPFGRLWFNSALSRISPDQASRFGVVGIRLCLARHRRRQCTYCKLPRQYGSTLR